MALHVMFIGNKFIYNTNLRDYVLRGVEKNGLEIEEIRFYKENNSSIFLVLQQKLLEPIELIVVTTKENFATIGKLLSTATEDVQIVKEGMLIPQKAAVFEQGSYLLEYQKTKINVIQITESLKMPPVLIDAERPQAVIHVFEEEMQTLRNLLNPIAQTYEVHFELITLVEGWIRVDVHSKQYGDISKFIAASKRLLPKKVIASTNIVGYIIEIMAKHGKKITFAESCTGGLLAYTFTKNNGASKILDGSLVTYSNDLKENWLAVEEGALVEHGAVSAEVVEQMSEGALNVSNADYALAVSGIAGDTGGTKEKPVGTVYIGVRGKNGHKEEHLYFKGDRNFVQAQSVLYAIKMLINFDKNLFF